MKDAARNIQIADHMIYVTLPIVNEKRLLLKIFEEIYKAIINSIHSMLSYEEALGRVKVEGLAESINQFFTLARKNGLSHEQLKTIREILELRQWHVASASEFVRREKVVIMSDSLSVKAIDLKRIKEFLLVAKELLLTVSKRMSAT
ncbi:MAG: hypothetical protein RL557_789 [archaeon]